MNTKAYFFFIKLLALTAFSVVFLMLCGNHPLLSKFITSHYLLVPGIFFFATAIVHLFVIKSHKGKSKNFINFFMIVTFLKLMLYMGIILIYILLFRQSALAFVISFLMLYIFYTGFEVMETLRFYKGESDKGDKGDK